MRVPAVPCKAWYAASNLCQPDAMLASAFPGGSNLRGGQMEKSDSVLGSAASRPIAPPGPLSGMLPLIRRSRNQTGRFAISDQESAIGQNSEILIADG